jgi:hypothetical protein
MSLNDEIPADRVQLAGVLLAFSNSSILFNLTFTLSRDNLEKDVSVLHLMCKSHFYLLLLYLLLSPLYPMLQNLWLDVGAEHHAAVGHLAQPCVPDKKPLALAAAQVAGLDVLLI